MSSCLDVHCFSKLYIAACFLSTFKGWSEAHVLSAPFLITSSKRSKHQRCSPTSRRAHRIAQHNSRTGPKLLSDSGKMAFHNMSALAELPRYRIEKELGNTGGEREKTGWISPQQDGVRLQMPTLASCLLSLWYRHKVRWVVYHYVQPLLSPQSNYEFTVNWQVNKGYLLMWIQRKCWTNSAFTLSKLFCDHMASRRGM